MIEVEIKVKISDPELMREKFRVEKGFYKISLLHEDTYFNMPEKLRDFKKTDEALRIRKSIGFNKLDKSSIQKITYYLTYKGAKLDTTTKTRKEIEVKIEDGEAIIEIFEILGFQKIFTVKKERELYEFEFENYNIEALIDYIPILKQHFIEVEFMAETQDKIDKARQILFDFLKKFGIQKEESITKSYLELIADRFKRKVNK